MLKIECRWQRNEMAEQRSSWRDTVGFCVTVSMVLSILLTASFMACNTSLEDIIENRGEFDLFFELIS